MELLRIERLVELYYKQDEAFYRDYNVDNVPFDVLNEVVDKNEGDDLLYDFYDLNLNQVVVFNQYLEDKINIDFELYDYVLGNRGIYKYGDGTISE